MELIWKEIEAERLIAEASAQVRIQGELPSPDGRAPKAEPCCSAKVVIDAAETAQGEVRIVGRIPVLVTCFDEDGKPFAYESSASFERTVAAEGVLPGMTARARAQIQSLRAAPSGAGVRLDADAEISVRVYSSVPMKVLGGANGADDLEIKKLALRSGRAVRAGGDVLRLREELAAEDVSEVICCEGVISVRETIPEQDGATAVGMITVTAVTADKAGRPGAFYRQVPFRERIPLDRRAENPYCTARLGALYLRSPGEGFGILAMEAEVAFDLWELQSFDVTAPTDAFSPTAGFDALTERTVFSEARGAVCRQLSLREELILPETASDPGPVITVNARPIVTEAYSDGKTLEVRGIITTLVMYESTAGRIVSFAEDVPFESVTDDPCGAGTVTASAACAAYSEGFDGRSLQVQYALVISAELEERREAEVLTGLAEREREKTTGGVLICFASEGECVFDIAKRYGVPCEKVRSLNPGRDEPFREGERLILLV